MTLSIRADHRLGAFHLDADFESAGGLTVLFGRSGSGKTSLVNVAAGLIHPRSGRVAIDGRVLLDTQKGVFVPAHRRRVGYVFQEARLFSHLTVRGNLDYGRWFTPVSERRESFDNVVAMLGIDRLLDRRPALLSGGEKQRVAIGRALMTSPRLLLMDEPLASLDEGRKSEILPYIECLRDHSGLPIIYVSHSVAEVTRLASTVVVLSQGRRVAAGPPGDVLADPALFPAIGRHEAGSMIAVRIEGHDRADGLTMLAASGGRLIVPYFPGDIGSPLRVHIRARDIILALSRPRDISALNMLPVTITKIGDATGAIVEVQLACGDDLLLARITRRSVAALGIEPGKKVFAILKSVAIGRRDIAGANAAGIVSGG